MSSLSGGFHLRTSEFPPRRICLGHDLRKQGCPLNRVLLHLILGNYDFCISGFEAEFVPRKVSCVVPYLLSSITFNCLKLSWLTICFFMMLKDNDSFFIYDFSGNTLIQKRKDSFLSLQSISNNLYGGATSIRSNFICLFFKNPNNLNAFIFKTTVFLEILCPGDFS